MNTEHQLHSPEEEPRLVEVEEDDEPAELEPFGSVTPEKRRLLSASMCSFIDSVHRLTRPHSPTPAQVCRTLCTMSDRLMLASWANDRFR